MWDIQESDQVYDHVDAQVPRGGRGRGDQGYGLSLLNSEQSTEHLHPNTSDVMDSSSRGRGGERNNGTRKDPGTLCRSL